MTGRKQGTRLPAAQRRKGLRLVRAGRTTAEIKKAMGVASATVWRWRQAVKAADARSKQAVKPKKPKSTKSGGPSKIVGTTMLNAAVRPHLAEIGQMLRTSFPDLTRFNLSTQNGVTTVDYTIRQVTEHAGVVKL